MNTLSKHFTLLILISFAATLHAQSAREKRHQQIQKRLQDTADLKYNYFAPSVHIRYHHPEKQETYLGYYNEIRVEETVKHTYFCTIGFDVGYLGIQDHGSGHLAIFSVWDKGGGKDDSSAVDEADQTQVLYSNPEAKSSRFGGEGSGAKTMMPFAWEIGKTYRFLVMLTPQEQGTIYTAWISEIGKDWQKIASYKTVMTKKKLQSFYSFVEDYARNGQTGQKARLAYYPRQAVMSPTGDWLRIANGSGTIADDLIQNGHSGIKNNLFFSKSGAATEDYQTQPKRFSIELDQENFALESPK